MVAWPSIACVLPFWVPSLLSICFGTAILILCVWILCLACGSHRTLRFPLLLLFGSIACTEMVMLLLRERASRSGSGS